MHVVLQAARSRRLGLGCVLGRILKRQTGQLTVLRFVDYTHATGPQFLQDVVARDDLPGSGGGEARSILGWGRFTHTGNNASLGPYSTGA